MERKPYYDADPRRRGQAAPRSQGNVRRSAPARYRDGAERRAQGEPSRRMPPQGNPRRPQSAPRRRKKDPAAIVLPVVMVLAALAIVVYVGSAWFTSTINSSTYCNNIYINGISISGCTRDEAPEYINGILQQQLSEVYTLTWKDQRWSFCALRLQRRDRYLRFLRSRVESGACGQYIRSPA